MLLEKRNRSWKNGFTAIICCLSILFCMSGCSEAFQDITQPLVQTDGETAEEVMETYCDIYENTAEAAKTGAAGDLEVVRSIVNGLGEKGYTAVDYNNQVDMVCPEQAVQFCKTVDAKEAAELTILSVLYNNDFIKYDFKTSNGAVLVTRETYTYQNGSMIKIDMTTYPAYSWRYTREGYLFFEEYHMPGYDGPSGHTAIRVQPLDEICRELNRKYILPIGYERNDMFLSDWSEEDFGEINFYDLFDILYPVTYEKNSPYKADDNCGIGAVYRIAKNEFETVIMEYFKIDSMTLRSKTRYVSDEESYEYRPRGLYDCEPPSYPYPEVVEYTENSDRTVSLTVCVVYPDANTSKAYAHKVTVRPLPDGKFQYVSNQIIPAKDNDLGSWHVNRLTDEEWKEYYGGDK